MKGSVGHNLSRGLMLSWIQSHDHIAGSSGNLLVINILSSTRLKSIKMLAKKELFLTSAV